MSFFFVLTAREIGWFVINLNFKRSSRILVGHRTGWRNGTVLQSVVGQELPKSQAL